MKFIPWKEDKWLSQEGSILPWDKLEHFLLAMIGFIALFLLGLDETQCFTLGILAGIAWEIRDSFITGFSWKDLIADGVGLIIGLAITLMI